MVVSEHPNLYYDLSAIKDIPILDVAAQLGIPVQKKGKNYWCKVRDENNPSVILHPERNSYYDFGNQSHGDVIAFVQYARDFSYGTAIRYLGESFGLEPNLTWQQLLDRPLTNLDYACIGLHGDMATKNFVFPIETASLEELCEISSGYRMPLNQLLRENPEVYKSIIRQSAIPYVEKLRNCYYLDVWNYFHLVYAMGDNSTNLYKAKKVYDRFQKDTTALNKAERVLFRACKKAGIDLPEPPQYNPVAVIRKLLRGALPISLGNTAPEALANTAQQAGCTVLEVKVPFYSYFDDRLLDLRHAAKYQAGEVTVQYLSSDASQVEPLLKELNGIPNRPLEVQIRDAAKKRTAMASQPVQPEKSLEIH